MSDQKERMRTDLAVRGGVDPGFAKGAQGYCEIWERRGISHFADSVRNDGVILVWVVGWVADLKIAYYYLEAQEHRLKPMLRGAWTCGTCGGGLRWWGRLPILKLPLPTAPIRLRSTKSFSGHWRRRGHVSHDNPA